MASASEKRPAHEAILERLERDWKDSAEGTLQEREVFARSAITLLGVLSEMVIPRKELEQVVERLRRISTLPHLERRTPTLEAGMLDWNMSALLKELSGTAPTTADDAS